MVWIHNLSSKTKYSTYIVQPLISNSWEQPQLEYNSLAATGHKIIKKTNSHPSFAKQKTWEILEINVAVTLIIMSKIILLACIVIVRSIVEWSRYLTLRQSDCCRDQILSQITVTWSARGLGISKQVGTLIHWVCLVPKFLSPNFTIHLSHQISYLMYGGLNVGK